jgi:hypothetical protein
MNWRSARRVVGTFLLLILAAALIEWAALPHRFTPQEADHIRSGMTPEEVEGVLGRPPDLTSRDCAEWVARASGIDVRYREGRVERVVFKSAPAPGVYTRWMRHLGLES